MSTLRRFLDVRPEERRNTFAAFATLLLITTGHTLLETARDALFLSKLPASQLPWMYLVIVVLALGLTRLRAADSRGVIIGMLAFASVVTGGFWVVGRHLSSHHWVLYALYIWSGLFASWITVQFWTLLGRVHTMTQAKRLYGFIGAGAVLGGVVGAFSARAAIAFVPPRMMLLGSAVLFLLSAAPVYAVRVPIAAPVAAPVRVATTAEPSMTSGARLLWQHPFARRILGISLAATVAFTLTDYVFKARIAQAYPDTRTLAAWLSTFYAVSNTASLVAQLFIGPWIFRTVGVQRALFLFPILLVLASGGVLVTGGLLGAAVLMKGLDGTLRYSVHKTSMELLLVPVPDGTRERIKPIIELVGSRGGQALAGIGVLALVAVGAAGTLTVSAVVFGVAVLWVALVVSIRGHYLDVFRETLHSGGLSGRAELPELDLGALEMLFTGLNSSHDIEVLASLELLAEQNRERLIPALILYHPSREVVLRALDLFTTRHRTDFVSIADRLNAHPDREVAAAALRARTAVAPDRALLEKRLEDPCPQVAATALVALMARGWIDDDDADRRMNEAIATRSWQTAAELAHAIRDIAADPSEEPRELTLRIDDLLIRLAREAGTFRDLECATSETLAGRTSETQANGRRGVWTSVELAPDVRVRLEVARAMAARQRPAYLPVLVGMLARHELRATARDAIARIPGALGVIESVMAEKDFARNVRVHLPRTMVRFEPQVVAPKLIARLLHEEDGAVRFKIIRALIKLRRENPKLSLEESTLREAADQTLAHAMELRRWHLALAAGDTASSSAVGADPLRAAHHLLVDLVRDKVRHATQRLFMLLELIHREDFETIERGVRSKDPKKHANSLELIENLVRPPLRARVLALVGDEAPTDVPGYEPALLEILETGSETMRTLAEYRAVELGIDIDAVTGRRSKPPTMESIGQRLVDRARNILTPEPIVVQGGNRAPA